MPETAEMPEKWVQDALEAGHVKLAVLLCAHGGSLGPSGDPTLLDLLDAPEAPNVYEAKRLVNRLMWQQVVALTPVLSPRLP